MHARFCLKCGTALIDREDGGLPRRACPAEGCGFVHYDNPVPVVAAVVELPEGVVLVRSRGWPEGLFGLVTGFLERGEEPHQAVLREVHEELGLEATLVDFIGIYGFERFNQVILAWHVRAEGTPVAGEELEAIKVVPVERLKPWPFATGLALRDWLARRVPSRPPEPGRTD